MGNCLSGNSQIKKGKDFRVHAGSSSIEMRGRLFYRVNSNNVSERIDEHTFKVLNETIFRKRELKW